MVLFIIDGPGCGKGSALKYGPPGESRSWVEFGCGPLVLAHELGHNMGANHDHAQYEASAIKDWHFNYGYLLPDSKKRTVMA